MSESQSCWRALRAVRRPLVALSVIALLWCQHFPLWADTARESLWGRETAGQTPLWGEPTPANQPLWGEPTRDPTPVFAAPDTTPPPAVPAAPGHSPPARSQPATPQPLQVAPTAVGSPIPVQSAPLARPPASVAGQQTGEQGLQFPPPVVDADGNLIMAPGTPQSLTVPANDLFPGSAGGSTADLQRLYGDDSGIRAATGQAQQRLSTEATLEGEAYRTVISGAPHSWPDLSADPIWGGTDATMGDLDGWAATFATCQATTFVEDQPTDAHVPKYETCERVSFYGPYACDATHTLQIDRRSFGIGFNVTGKDDNTVRVDLSTGRWERIEPSDGDSFSITAPVLNVNDLCATPAKPAVIWNTSFTSTGCLDGKNCAKLLQAPTCSNGLQAVLQLNDSCGGDDVCGKRGPNKFTSYFNFELGKIRLDEWDIPDECHNLWATVTDQFCQGDGECNDMGPNETCRLIGGYLICEDDPVGQQVDPIPLGGAGLSKLCGSAHLTADCRYHLGDMACWTDPQGTQHCPKVEDKEAVENTCEPLENNAACGFVRSACVDGAQGASSNCYVYEDTYDCGYDVAVPGIRVDTNYACVGTVRCLGEDCLDLRKEQNANFGQAAAAFQAAQAMATDTHCDAAQPQSCRVFTGEAMECKKAVGGIVNCCQEPGTTSMTDYITLMFAVFKLDQAIMSAQVTSGAGQAIQGAWSTLRQPVAQTLETVTGPFTSATENLFGIGQIGIEQAITNAAAETVGQLFGTEAQRMLFESTVDAVTGITTWTLSPALQAAMGYLSIIMTAYTLYQIALMLIQIIWQCEQDEFELGAKRELKSCHHVGSYCKTQVFGQCIEKRESYCCFSSPLSRILQEQIRPQLGMGWGSGKNPDCDGITAQRLNQVNWNRVDLDEWLGLLTQSGRFPAVRDLSTPGLTGSGNLLDTTGTRPDTQTRTQERINSVPVDQIRNQVGEDLWETR